MFQNSEQQPATLVTGGGGFIGSHLVDRLIELGQRVVVLDDMSTGQHKNIHTKAETVFKPIQHLPYLADFHRQIDKVETIYHLAAVSSIPLSFKYPSHAYDVNSTGTIQVLEFAQKHNAKVIYAGSSSADYGIAESPYAYTKWLGEKHCSFYFHRFGVSTCIARFYNVFGPRNSNNVLGIFEKQYRENQPLTVFGDGNQRRDFIHVQDIVSGLVAMAQGNVWDATIFNLGTGTNHSINELVNMFHPRAVTYLPKREGDFPENLADISLAKEKLGWEPKYKVEDYVKDFVKAADNK